MKIFIPKEYPAIPPKIVSMTKVVHPNINMDTGEVAIAMLKQEDWRPSLK